MTSSREPAIVGRPAPRAATILAQTRVELRLTARRGENLLALIGIPAAVLLFFGSIDLLPVPVGATRIGLLLPGTLALAILATGLVNLGIATGYERSYGVLKRLGGSPLGRSGLVAAKLASVVVVELVVLTVLVALAAAIFGWRPGASPSAVLLVGAVVLGTAAFAGLGLALAGMLRAEATLALANALFIGSLLLGGVIVPSDHLPGALASISGLLPSSALTDVFRVALGASGDVGPPLAVLTAWAIGAVTVAVRTFRWE